MEIKCSLYNNKFKTIIVSKNHKGWANMIQLNGQQLTMEQMETILYGKQQVVISDDAKKRVEKVGQQSNASYSRIKRYTGLIQASENFAM